MRKNKIVVALLSGLMITSMTVSSLAATGNTSVKGNKCIITKQYISTNKDKETTFEDKVVVSDKRYKLKEITYDSEVLSETKKIQTGDKDDFEKTYEKTIDGTTYTFVADIDNIEWKTEKVTEILNEYREYGRKDTVPKSIEVNGLVYKLAKFEDGERTENVTWPADFYSFLKSTPKATFNNHEVPINGTTPTWDGYEDDVIEYLGYNKAKTVVEGGKWTTDWEEYGDGYIRHAEYWGKRTLPIYTAKFTYTGVEGGKTVNTAKVKYIADGNYKITATALYKRILTKTQRILIGGGLVVILVGGVASIMAVAKKRKSDED